MCVCVCVCVWGGGGGGGMGDRVCGIRRLKANWFEMID